MNAIQKLDRRSFLKTSAAATGGLILGFYLPEHNQLQAQSAAGKLNAYVRIGTDDSVTLYIHKAEMGQGTVTSLSMLLAEELECDWKKIRTEFPGVDPVAFGPMQGVFGSMSVRTSWEPLRKAGATAAEMLVQAAAQKWNVPKSQCRAENNSVVNLTTKERLSYGSLAEAASKLPVPQQGVALKDPTQFKLVGKSQKRMDTPAKVTGKTTFGIDVKVPGMLYATLQRSPVFGGKVKTFDAAKAKAVPGVKQVVQISNGVAVLADNTWAAMEGKIYLKTKIDIPPLSGKVKQKLQLDGIFRLTQAMFLRSKIQSQIDTFSRRGQGKPTDEEIVDVPSGLAGSFKLNNEVITFRSLSFAVPGAGVDLTGDYNIRADELDFHGTLRLQAKVSETMSGWKRWVLKPVDPFFAKQGAGTLIHIQVTGSSDSPKFGRDKGNGT